MKHTCLFINSTRVLSESASLGSQLRENLEQTVLPASRLISLQQNNIESNKLDFMMKYHFDFLPTKF